MLEEPLSSVSQRHELTVAGRAWIDLERPTSAEVRALARDFALDPGDLETALDRGEATGVRVRDAYVVVTARVPLAPSGRSSSRLTDSPATILAGRDFLVTIHTGEIRPLMRLFQQCETDASARETAFSQGIGGLVQLVLQRLLDATANGRPRIDRVLEVEDSGHPTRSQLTQVSRLRAEARAAWRLAAAFPALVGALERQFPLESDGESWPRLAARAERLVQSIEDDLATFDGLLLTAAADAGLETARLLRVIVATSVLTLPVIAAALVISMPVANPLAGQRDGYAIGLAVVGAVFLTALALLKRGGFV